MGFGVISILWPGGKVPYEISPGYTSQELSDIQYAMDAFHKHTCIKFQPRAPSDMCYGDVGRQTSAYFRTPEGKFRTRMNMHSSCLNRPNWIHELMHTIGFHHEHQREDRDPRVTAGPRSPDARYDYWNRVVYPRTYAHYMGNYDPESIMHYPAPGFKPYQRKYFSQSDIDNIKKLYRC
ncbi:unnamed protein product [Cylicostephanus goldi]|uniref:Metalloendopeptidase n=1 Tax=Cylicostephanus goldi TaxID=71465 RepID=A0A3P6QPC6_CYLGO|nr:unnamed protein product [Cylicostephanus goldi]